MATVGEVESSIERKSDARCTATLEGAPPRLYEQEMRKRCHDVVISCAKSSCTRIYSAETPTLEDSLWSLGLTNRSLTPPWHKTFQIGHAVTLCGLGGGVMTSA